MKKVLFGFLSLALVAGCSGGATVANNVIDFDTVQVGDQVGAMTVVSAEKNIEEVDFADWNAIIDFEGEITLTGDYYHVPLEGPFFSNQVCITSLDAESYAKRPRKDGEITDQGYNLFCFENNDFAKAAFGSEPGDTGTATFTIDSYQYVGIESEVVNLANLVSVE